MVCAKCQKLSKGTTLATPEVKKKSDMYYGSPAGTSKAAAASSKPATLGHNGIGKVSKRHPPPPRAVAGKRCANKALQSKLLSKSAKNPYAQYSR